jgi:prophage regulatory protein
MPTATVPAEQRVLSMKTVLDRVPISRTTLWRMVREGLFPPHIKLSANRIGWIEEDIDAWIASRKEQ